MCCVPRLQYMGGRKKKMVVEIGYEVFVKGPNWSQDRRSVGREVGAEAISNVTDCRIQKCS